MSDFRDIAAADVQNVLMNQAEYGTEAMYHQGNNERLVSLVVEPESAMDELDERGEWQVYRETAYMEATTEGIVAPSLDDWLTKDDPDGTNRAWGIEAYDPTDFGLVRLQLVRYSDSKTGRPIRRPRGGA